jgi:hypothetical protein
MHIFYLQCMRMFEWVELFIYVHSVHTSQLYTKYNMNTTMYQVMHIFYLQCMRGFEWVELFICVHSVHTSQLYTELRCLLKTVKYLRMLYAIVFTAGTAVTVPAVNTIVYNILKYFTVLSRHRSTHGFLWTNYFISHRS